ncbi:hypothetical protein LTR66_009956, partial [Elasticomyces elasticus]
MATPTARSPARENRSRSQVSADAAALSKGVKRSVLGDLSTNAQLTPQRVAAQANKLLKSSPLKRSVMDVARNENGLMGVKKRKRSTELDQNRQHSPLKRDAFQAQVAGIERFRQFAPVADTVSTKTKPPTVELEYSSTEPDTPSDNGDASQLSSLTKASFSSLINYDPSSQIPAYM